MDRKRIADEVVEILSHKLHNLPHPKDVVDFSEYEHQKLVPDITKDPLDIAEVAMDLEDAFGVNFDKDLPGDPGMDTIGSVIDYLHQRVNRTRATAESIE